MQYVQTAKGVLFLGLEANAAAQNTFADFLNGLLSANQRQFVQIIICRFIKYGIVDRTVLFESPFTNLHDKGVIVLFFTDAGLIIGIVERINQNAMVA